MPAGPAFSVIIPCRNENDQIEGSVRSMLGQESVPGGLEVIVADGMSEDGTRETLARLAAEDPRLRVVDNAARITPCGMNAGIRAARGRFIAIAGAHNRYAPDYLRRAAEVLAETGADNVGGSMICEGDLPLQRAIGAAHHSPFSAGGARWHRTSYDGPADTVFGGIYRREVFDRIGFFDEELVRNQDDELNLRLTRSHGRIWHSSRLRSWYRPRNSLARLFRQYMQYGFWKVRVIQKHRIPASIRHLVPGFFVLVLLTLPVLAAFWRPALAVWLALVAVYVLSNVAASVTVALKEGWDLLPFLPLVFACYHFGYGIGFLRGIWTFFVAGRSPNEQWSGLTRPSAKNPAGRERG